MPRGYRRRYRSYRYSTRSKYSNETTSIVITVPSGGIEAGATFPEGTDTQGNAYKGCMIVPPTGVYGCRKAKNFDISITTAETTTPIIAALVYIPQGTLAQDMNLSAFTPDGINSLYEPNQNVIGQFVIPATFDGSTQTVTRFKTRLARNLDSGDSIVLLFGNVSTLPEGANICCTANYAIKY